jgi:hypothetical protein
MVGTEAHFVHAAVGVHTQILEKRANSMNKSIWLLTGWAFLALGVMSSRPALAEFEVVGPDGRRIQLKDNGTWRYAGTSAKNPAEGKLNEVPRAVLHLESKVERGNSCRFVVRLVNDLPYEINSFVPYFSVYRANGVIYDTVPTPSSFAGLKPSDVQSREFEIAGIPCKDIVRVQVVGGDKCIMSDLNRFSDAKGACLARVEVVASDLVRFDK